jgi:hypothetical protein
MAVTIKKKELTLVSLAKRILDNAEMIKLAKAIEASGYKLTTEPTLLKVENQNAILAQTPLKLSAIEKCLKGDLSYAGKTMLQDHIETFIKKAFNLMPEVTAQVNIAAVYDGTMKVARTWLRLSSTTASRPAHRSRKRRTKSKRGSPS